MARARDGGGFEPATSTERVLDVVVRNPSVWGLEIARRTGDAQAHVHTNLEFLESHGHVEVQRIGWQKHYAHRFTPWDVRFLAALGDDATWAFLDHVAARPGLDNQDEIGTKAGLTPKAIRSSAETLLELTVVAKVRIPTPGLGRPGIGYEVRWRDLSGPLGLLAMKLHAEAPQAKRLHSLLQPQPE